MKRWARRTVTVALGLMLGWYAAGLWSHDTWGAVSPANGQTPTDHAAQVDLPHDHHDQDPGQQEAGNLVPVDPATGQPATPHWYRYVITGVIGLFVAAIILGIPALKVRGPEPPDPADEHSHDDDHHAAH